MDELPIIKCAHNELVHLPDEETHGIYITEKGTFYYVNGDLHREDGPAWKWKNGDKYWRFNNKLHRLDGPAIEYNNGRSYYYINGKEYISKKEYEVAAYLYKNGLEKYE